MKRLYLTCLAVAAMAIQAMAVNPLVIRDSEKDTSVAVGEVSHVTFAADGSVTVHCTDSKTIVIAADKFVSLRFNNDRPAGVIDVVADDASSLSFGNGVITSSVAGINLYDAAGAVVASSATEQLATDGVAPGVYVVVSGSSTLKIVVK